VSQTLNRTTPMRWRSAQVGSPTTGSSPLRRPTATSPFRSAKARLTPSSPQFTSGVSIRGSISLMLASVRRPHTPNDQRKRVERRFPHADLSTRPRPIAKLNRLLRQAVCRRSRVSVASPRLTQGATYARPSDPYPATAAPASAPRASSGSSADTACPPGPVPRRP